MYSKFGAILINSVFAICIAYTVFSVWFALTSKFAGDRKFVLGFSLYNMIWLVLDIAYNAARYHRQGGGLFFWTSIILQPVLLILILMGVIILFFNNVHPDQRTEERVTDSPSCKSCSGMIY